MDNNEILMKIEKILESNKYDIEEILKIIPDDLKENVKDILKNNIKNESKLLKLEKR